VCIGIARRYFRDVACKNENRAFKSVKVMYKNCCSLSFGTRYSVVGIDLTKRTFSLGLYAATVVRWYVVLHNEFFMSSRQPSTENN